MTHAERRAALRQIDPETSLQQGEAVAAFLQIWMRWIKCGSWADCT